MHEPPAPTISRSSWRAFRRFAAEPEPGDFAVQAECASAIDTLHAVGVLDEGEYADWHARRLAAEATWLDDPVPPPACRAYAIEVPAETEEEAAEDAAVQAAWESRPKAATVSRVVMAPRNATWGW